MAPTLERRIKGLAGCWVNPRTKRPRFRHNAGGSLAYPFLSNRGDAMWNTIKTDIMLLAMGLAAIATVFGAELRASDIWSLLDGAN